MAYKVCLGPRAVTEIRGWQLPDGILDEVYLFLREVLPADLEDNLVREHAAGMSCSLTRRDHHVLAREHHFVFRVFFTQDEQALYVERGAYDQENSQ